MLQSNLIAPLTIAVEHCRYFLICTWALTKHEISGILTVT